MTRNENFGTLSVEDGKLSHLCRLAGQGRINTSELSINTSEGHLTITAEGDTLTIQRDGE